MKQAEIKLYEMMAKRDIRTIKELSKKTGVTERIISGILNKKTTGLRLSTIVKFCEVLDCSLEELIVLPD